MKQIKRGHYHEDEFQSTMQKVAKFIVRHRQISITIAFAIILGITVFVYISSTSREAQNPEADLLYIQVMGLVNMGRFQEAETILLDLTTRFGNTRSGKIGYYYLGVIYYHTGRFQESLQNFDTFLSSQKGHYLLIPSAEMGAGCAAEGLKDYELARKYYEKISKDEDSPFYYVGALSYGRVTGLVGEKEEAIMILKDLLEKDPPPDIAADASFYIGYFHE
jgi:tetratricopeptide (TPR) repeat protein